MPQIIEGKAKTYIPRTKQIPTKDMPVFYNPAMALNRTISVLIVSYIANKEKRKFRIALPLAGSGIRGIRLILEANQAVKEILFNDINKKATQAIKKNLALNKIPKTKAKIFNQDANLFLIENKGFDYIDIDPFGSPNPFLDAAIKALSRNAILAVTATDTAPLAGTYPKTCLRKYWAKPAAKHPSAHEFALRILIRKVQLIAAQYEKALTPIYSYYKQHYYRAFFICKKGATKTDRLLAYHKTIEDKIGPLWTGPLWNNALAKAIAKMHEATMLKRIAEECKILNFPFMQYHALCKKNQLQIPKLTSLMANLKKAGFKAARTHFSDYGIRTTAKEEDIIKTIKQLTK